MGWYREHVVPRIVDCACGNPGLEKFRREISTSLTGVVVEIGFGAGRNIPYYPENVSLVYAVEPSALAGRLAASRIESSKIPINHIGLDGQAIPLEAGVCDSALVTFTLCTVPDPNQALDELFRVLRPGGTIHFLEHGIAPDANVAKWQRRIDPVERRIADGCELTRDPLTMVTTAGFLLGSITQQYGKGPKPWSYFTYGVATKPESSL